MDIVFIAGFSLIVDGNSTRDLLKSAFGIPLKGMEADAEYVFADSMEGAKHFGVWPLHQAAEACFGKSEWPKNLPVPQATIEFEVKDADAVAAAEKELRAKGHELLHGARTEPWGQTVCRLLTKEGVIIGVSFAPWFHEKH